MKEDLLNIFVWHLKRMSSSSTLAIRSASCQRVMVLHYQHGNTIIDQNTNWLLMVEKL